MDDRFSRPSRTRNRCRSQLANPGWSREQIADALMWGPRGRPLSSPEISFRKAWKWRRLQALGRSQTYGVLLPVSGFHTDGRYADARALLAAGGQLVLASNYNPGSSPCFSMAFVIALALRKLGLSALEAIRACTERPAALLSLSDRGTLTPGARADLILLRHRDERLLGYELGGKPVQQVIVARRDMLQRDS